MSRQSGGCLVTFEAAVEARLCFAYQKETGSQTAALSTSEEETQFGPFLVLWFTWPILEGEEQVCAPIAGTPHGAPPSKHGHYRLGGLFVPFCGTQRALLGQRSAEPGLAQARVASKAAPKSCTHFWVHDVAAVSTAVPFSTPSLPTFQTSWEGSQEEPPCLSSPGMEDGCQAAVTNRLESDLKWDCSGWVEQVAGVGCPVSTSPLLADVEQMGSSPDTETFMSLVLSG